MIDALRNKYLSVKDQFKTNWNDSLFFRIAFSLFSVMFVMATLFGSVAGVTVYYSISMKESAALKSRLDLLSADIEHKISIIVSNSGNLAKNTLVMNALVDTQGRDGYLVPFLKGHTEVGGIPHAVCLCDFQGSVIASNSDKSISFTEKELLDTVVTKGKTFVRIEKQRNGGDNHLIAIHPVMYPATGTIEGFLVVDVALKDIVGLAVRENDGISAGIFQKNQLIAGVAGKYGVLQRRKLAFAGAASVLDLDVEARAPRSYAIIWCAVAMLGIMALMGRLIFRISFRISDNLTTRLVVLNEAARRISESGVPDRKVPLAGKDEIGLLAEAFNKMVDQLRESYDVLESRVEERTRLLAKANETLTEEIEQRLEAEYRLKELNENLEATVKFEIEQHREKERMLIQQNRLASMGEMIGNIAHQWRQPLNNVGLIVQSLQIEFESGALTPEAVRREVANCMLSIRYMSDTIDDFRNFFRPNKVKKRFSVIDVVSRTAALIRPTLDNHGIVLSITENESGEISGYENEFGQVLMNLLNNAKDTIVERQTPNPLIEIRCFNDGGRTAVTVRDNAGGIAESMIDKVFDPYFTTKFQTQGTGLGLYMAKIIIEKNMDGVLSVNNLASGAEFRIVI